MQVMLFSDRLEVLNSGSLPASLTVNSLSEPHQSVPRNPLLAESMYLSGYIERMGTGTVDMMERCVSAGLREPEFVSAGNFTVKIGRPVIPQVTPQVTDEIMQLLEAIVGDMKRTEIQETLGLRDKKNFRTSYLKPAIDQELIEMTIPDTPTSSLQKYRLTEKGRAAIENGLFPD